MRRPVGATDDVFAITGYGDVTCVVGHLRFGHEHAARLLPEVDLGHLAVTALGVPEAAGNATHRFLGIVVLGSLDDVYRVAGIDVIDNFVRVAVDNGDLAGVTLDDDKEVFPVTAVQRLVRIILRAR